MRRPLLAALVTGLVLGTVMTYPTIVHPASFSRADSDDGKYSLWNVAWVAHALITDPAARLRRQHLLSASRDARLLGSESGGRCAGGPGLRADARSSGRAQRRRLRRARPRVPDDVGPGAPAHGVLGRGYLRRYGVRLLRVRLGAYHAHPATDGVRRAHGAACLARLRRSTGSGTRGGAWAGPGAGGVVERLLRHLHGTDDRLGRNPAGAARLALALLARPAFRGGRRWSCRRAVLPAVSGTPARQRLQGRARPHRTHAGTRQICWRTCERTRRSTTLCWILFAQRCSERRVHRYRPIRARCCFPAR